jgi:hypothetical protein
VAREQGQQPGGYGDGVSLLAFARRGAVAFTCGKMVALREVRGAVLMAFDRNIDTAIA